MTANAATTRRRVVVALVLTAGLQTVSGRVFSQPVRRIGFLAEFKAPTPQSPVWLRDRLKALGFEEGRNLAIERGYTTSENLDAMARELVARGVEVIVALTNGATDAALKATRTIPIVVVYGISPLEAGFAHSLSRPGGNVTGNAFYSTESVTKSFEVMSEAFPKARRAGFLWFNTGRRAYRSLAHAFATKLGQLAADRHIAFQPFELHVRRPEEVPGALSGIKAASLDVLLFSNDGEFPVDQEVANFAFGARLPTIGSNSDWVDRGGLFYFGPDEQEPIERTPRYVAQLLRGAKAAELAMELPSRYHLSINMKTARTLGYAIPDALRIRADRIVE